MDQWNYDMSQAPKFSFCVFGCNRGGEVVVMYRKKSGDYIVNNTGLKFDPVGWMEIPPVNLSM